MDTGPIRDFLALLAEKTPLLTSTRSRLRRQYAAAGLARCRALLEGICILREQGRADVIGVLNRSVIEMWLVSLYVLVKGRDEDDDSALIELGIEHARYMGILGDRFDSPEIKSAVADWKEAIAGSTAPDGESIKERPNFEAIARALPALLAKDDPDGLSVPSLALYDKAYRSESSFSAHPGVGSFGRYIAIDPSEERDGIVDNPGPPFPDQELLAVTLTSFLADRVFKAFGIPPDPRIAEAYNRISAAMGSEGGSL
jgi:hypothetical protein